MNIINENKITDSVKTIKNWLIKSTKNKKTIGTKINPLFKPSGKSELDNVMKSYYGFI